MASPDLELQGAIVSRLRSYAPLTALVGQKVYDLVPADASEPYVDIGEAYCLRADATCVDGQEVRLTLHAWDAPNTGNDNRKGFMFVKQVADAVVTALHQHPMTLPTNRLISISHRLTRTFRDGDGATSHAVIEFVAQTERQ